jgi:hypothetical protein
MTNATAKQIKAGLTNTPSKLTSRRGITASVPPQGWA